MDFLLLPPPTLSDIMCSVPSIIPAVPCIHLTVSLDSWEVLVYLMGSRDTKLSQALEGKRARERMPID